MIGLVAGFLWAAGGCTAPVGPEMLRIDRARYDEVFDAAVEAARSLDLPPARRDRRAGTIETQPHIAPSLLEPWRQDGTTFDQRLAQTVALDRRWARFEFTPVGAVRTEPAPDALHGPDVLGLRPPPDRSASTEDLQLRVEVFLERSHHPHMRRSTWTRSATTYFETVRPGTTKALLPRTFWTPLRRDRRFERLLLARVEEVLAEQRAEGAGD